MQFDQRLNLILAILVPVAQFGRLMVCLTRRGYLRHLPLRAVLLGLDVRENRTGLSISPVACGSEKPGMRHPEWLNYQLYPKFPHTRLCSRTALSATETRPIIAVSAWPTSMVVEQFTRRRGRAWPTLDQPRQDGSTPTANHPRTRHYRCSISRAEPECSSRPSSPNGDDYPKTS